MNLLQGNILYIYVFFSTCERTNKYTYQGFLADNTRIHVTNKTIATLETSTRKIDAKVMKYALIRILLKVLSRNACCCNCSNRNTIAKTISSTKNNNNENNKNNYSKILSFGTKLLTTTTTQKPQKYIGTYYMKRHWYCPNYVEKNGFQMNKLAAGYWPKYYNMKEHLNCFKLNVVDLTPTEMTENSIIYSKFSDMVNWRECHFEIRPPEAITNIKHFLCGNSSDKGVMRNIIITKVGHAVYSFEEESPDQWLMLRNLVVLRDCNSGDMVVFSKVPWLTTMADITQVLQDMGAEIIGKMMCDQDDDWLD